MGGDTHYFYPENTVMVQLSDFRLVYGDIWKEITEGISKQEMFKYLKSKNPHWNEVIFESIYWKAMELCIKQVAQKSG